MKVAIPFELWLEDGTLVVFNCTADMKATKGTLTPEIVEANKKRIVLKSLQNLHFTNEPQMVKDAVTLAIRTIQADLLNESPEWN